MNKEEIDQQISKAVISCKKCRLCKTRKKAVPGEGSLITSVIFVGEAPGQNEDEMGKPFVGRAGILLTELFKKIGYERSQIWIGNVIKCRPPENRAPMVDELRNCAPYLENQIKLINPKVIVTLGRFALEHFIKEGKISRDHGIPQIWKGRVVFPVYHPAAALRNPQVGIVLEKDFKKIPQVINDAEEMIGKVKEKTTDQNRGQMGFL